MGLKRSQIEAIFGRIIHNQFLRLSKYLRTNVEHLPPRSQYWPFINSSLVLVLTPPFVFKFDARKLKCFPCTCIIDLAICFLSPRSRCFLNPILSINTWVKHLYKYNNRYRYTFRQYYSDLWVRITIVQA